MIGLIIKIVLTLGSLFFTTFLFATGSWGWGIMFVFVTVILGLFIFRNENLIMAALQMRQQNMDKALKFLNRIKQPQFLMRGQRAYFYFLMGHANSTGSSMGQVESYFRKALNIGLKKDYDQAMAKLSIGAICLQTGRRREAETMLNEAKKLDSKGMLTEHIKGLKKQMGRATSRNQMRMAQMSKGKRGKMK
jgi:tetratricopeptide (TPR) repeat protein